MNVNCHLENKKVKRLHLRLLLRRNSVINVTTDFLLRHNLEVLAQLSEKREI